MGRTAVRAAVSVTLTVVAALAAAHWAGLLPDAWPLTGPATAGQAAGPGYTWNVAEPSGAPVTWPTCNVDFVVNPDGAPDGALEDVLAAAQRVQDASGITLTYLGTTDTVPDRGWVTDLTEAEPSRPVLVAWVGPDSGLLDADNGGKATLGMVGEPGNRHFASGLVVFNEALDADRDPGFGHGRARGAVYQHELAHVVGLGHVDDHDQLMFPHNGLRIDFGDGDLAGLAALGAHTCTP